MALKKPTLCEVGFCLIVFVVAGTGLEPVAFGL